MNREIAMVCLLIYLVIVGMPCNYFDVNKRGCGTQHLVNSSRNKFLNVLFYFAWTESLIYIPSQNPFVTQMKKKNESYISMWYSNTVYIQSPEVLASPHIQKPLKDERINMDIFLQLVSLFNQTNIDIFDFLRIEMSHSRWFLPDK